MSININQINDHVEKISDLSTSLNTLLESVNSEMPRLRKESSEVLGHILPLYKLKTRV
jgi:methyl-accepting chemotaxis protein